MTSATTDRGRATRQRIVDTASELFYLHGVSATGLSAILDASGAGKSQLYHYFRDKPDLVLAVATQQAERVMAAQQDLLAAIEEPPDLRMWVDGAVRVHEEGGPVRCPLGALAAELGAEPGLRNRLEAAFADWRTALSGAVTRLQDAGHVRIDRSADDLAEVLLCAYEGGVLLSGVHGSTRSLRLALDYAVDAMLVTA